MLSSVIYIIGRGGGGWVRYSVPAGKPHKDSRHIVADHDAGQRIESFVSYTYPTPRWPLDSGRLFELSRPARKVYDLFCRNCDFKTGYVALSRSRIKEL
jgi:hypothetical protein